MVYFDLNIPSYESDRHTNANDQSSLKRRRLQLTLKAMELGYTAVAYNRTIKGVMSESHRCSTALFPLSKLSPSSSSFFSSVEFHRRLLNVPLSSPFRQYTRLTVVVDNPSQASALNAGNPILRSYDVVAVRPMNQNAFDHACKTSEVDIIAIDFADKLQFRLKQPMVKAAVERGLHFEITYSGLIIDAQSRRQMISNCKLLVDWTRGKNLIFSSAAPSATEFRGPLDVANLVGLLGLPVERAKAAISKNCRSLISNALRKRHFHKEAVKVEERPSSRLGDRELSASSDWLKWDPISSGDGDILLDDMKKSFSMLNTLSKTPKTIDFSSTLNNLPVHGLQIKDLVPANKTAGELPDIGVSASSSMEVEGSVAVDEKPEQQDNLLKTQNSLNNLSKEQEEVVFPPEGQSFSHDPTSQSQASSSQDLKDSTFAFSASAEECHKESDIRSEANVFEKSVLLSGSSFVNSKGPVLDLGGILNYPNDVGVYLASKESQLLDTRSQKDGADVLPDGGEVPTITIDYENTDMPDNHVSMELSNPLNDSNLSTVQFEESDVEKRFDVSIYAEEGATANDMENEKGPSLVLVDASSGDVMAAEPHWEVTEISVPSNDGLPFAEFLCQTVTKDVPSETADIGTVDSSYQDVGPHLPGRGRRRQNRSNRPLLYRFKPLLSPKHFKRKPRKSRH